MPPAEVTPKTITPRRIVMVIALSTIITVATIVAAIGVLAAPVPLAHPVEMTSSLALQAIITVIVVGTLAQISLLSSMFAWEKFRRRRTGPQHSKSDGDWTAYRPHSPRSAVHRPGTG